MKKLWKQRMEPFRIWGNLYFCGSVPSSCHVIDTGEGLILYCNGTQGKGREVLAGDRYAFVDETEWAKYCDRTIATFEAMAARGQ